MIGLSEYDKKSIPKFSNADLSPTSTNQNSVWIFVPTMGYVWKSVPFLIKFRENVKIRVEMGFELGRSVSDAHCRPFFFQFGLAQFLIKKTPPWFKEKQTTHRIYFYCVLRYFQIPSHKAAKS